VLPKNYSGLPRGDAVALYACTLRGALLALRLADTLGAAVHVPFSLCRENVFSGSRSEIKGFASLAALMRERFHACRCHIFVAATGIAVRAIAPYLRDKAHDPAVVVIDQRGRHVISLLSGHLGGGNAMAEFLAEELGAEPVITTASDLEDLPSVDVLAVERGLIFADIAPVKFVSAALLAGKTVFLSDPGNFLGIRGGPRESLFLRFPARPVGPSGATASFPVLPSLLPERSASSPAVFYPSPDGSAPLTGAFPPAPDPAGSFEDAFCGPETAFPPGPCIVVTPHPPAVFARAGQDCLVLHPPLHAGIGCRRGASADDIRSALLHVLSLNALAPAALAALASIAAKKEEKGLTACARSMGLPLLFFPAAHLARFPVSSPSPKVREIFGIEGVCEPSALALARDFGGRERLLVPKTPFRGVTVALALSVASADVFS
jgi:cobalt-precorrin 5A hydrolase